MIHVIGVTKENTVEEQPSFTHVNWSDFNWLWIDLEKPTNEEIRQVTDTFQFHPMAIEHGFDGLKRPKLEHYHDHTFYITHVIKEEDGSIVKQELDFFVGEHFMVTVHQMPISAVNQVWNKLNAQSHLETWFRYSVFYQMLNLIVDSYFPVVENIENELEIIEDNPQNKKMNDLMTELFDMRKMLLHIGHTVNPMKDMLYQIINTDHLMKHKHKRKYFTRIHDHLLKLSEMVMTNREFTADIRDNYLSLNSYQTNRLMTVLTIVASIFTPLTFIAGVYGMNFINMPELTWTNGYYLVLGLMAVIAALMFLWFKRKGWFK